jgi:hypothetical protein
MPRRLLPLLLFLAACDPGHSFRGVVVDKQGRPVEDATVTFLCSETSAAQGSRGTVDAAGRFDLQGIGWMPNECFVRVQAPGRPAQDHAIGKSCTKRRGQGACLETAIHAVLDDAAPTPPQPPAHDPTTCEGAIRWLEAEAADWRQPTSGLRVAFDTLAPPPAGPGCDAAVVARVLATSDSLLRDPRALRVRAGGSPQKVSEQAKLLLTALKRAAP